MNGDDGDGDGDGGHDGGPGGEPDGDGPEAEVKEGGSWATQPTVRAVNVCSMDILQTRVGRKKSRTA